MTGLQSTELKIKIDPDDLTGLRLLLNPNDDSKAIGIAVKHYLEAHKAKVDELRTATHNNSPGKPSDPNPSLRNKR